MKVKVIISLGAALLVAVPAITFARGSGDDNPLKMMQQMFRGTPFGEVIDNAPGKDRGRSRDDDGRQSDRQRGRDGGDDQDGGRGGRHKGKGGGDDGGGRAGRGQQTDFEDMLGNQGGGGDGGRKGKRKKNRD